jgi:hypothetical protein
MALERKRIPVNAVSVNLEADGRRAIGSLRRAKRKESGKSAMVIAMLERSPAVGRLGIILSILPVFLTMGISSPGRPLLPRSKN